MKLLSTSAIVAVALAASPVWASEHSASNDDNMETSSETNMESSSEETTNMESDGSTTMESDGSMDMASDDNNMMSSEKNLDMSSQSGMLIRSRDITGGNVYTLNEANDEGWNSDVVYDTVGSDWESIGEIEDLVLDEKGQITGIVAEVGGFLDIGDKHVVISVNDLNLVAVDDRTYGYVTRLNEEDLESMEGVDEGFWN